MAELGEFAKHYDELKANEIRLIPVSVDSIERSRTTEQQLKLPFPLLSDSNREVLRLYGTLGHKQMDEAAPDGKPVHTPTLVVIDRNGTVRWIALDGAANARAVVTGVLLRSDNLQSLTARDVRLLVEQEMLEVVLDLRTDVEVQLEGPGPITREPRVRVEHRSLYPLSGGNTDLDAGSGNLWPPTEPSG